MFGLQSGIHSSNLWLQPLNLLPSSSVFCPLGVKILNPTRTSVHDLPFGSVCCLKLSMVEGYQTLALSNPSTSSPILSSCFQSFSFQHPPVCTIFGENLFTELSYKIESFSNWSSRMSPLMNATIASPQPLHLSSPLSHCTLSPTFSLTLHSSFQFRLW